MINIFEEIKINYKWINLETNQKFTNYHQIADWLSKKINKKITFNAVKLCFNKNLHLNLFVYKNHIFMNIKNNNLFDQIDWKYFCVEENKKFTSKIELKKFFKQFSNSLIDKLIKSSSDKSYFKIDSYIFLINKNYQPQISVSKILEKNLKDKTKWNQYNFEVFWQKIYENYPKNKEYLKFYSFYQEWIQSNIFNIKRLKDSFYDFNKPLFFADLETTFTSEIPVEELFVNFLKGFSENDKETLSNISVEKLKKWYKSNPVIKPYYWAFVMLPKFENVEDKYVLLNYNDSIGFLDVYPKSIKMLFHNLSYDALYLVQMFVDELKYEIVYTNKIIKEEYKKETGKQWKQSKKSIIIFANENKIMKMKIKNSLGKTFDIECSLLKLVASVEKLGKQTLSGTKKLKINYLQPRLKNHIFLEDEKSYIKNDVEIIRETFLNIENKYFERNGKRLDWKMTVSSTAFHELKKTVGFDEFALLFQNKFTNKIWKNMSKEQKLKYDNNNSLLTSKESKYLRNFYFGGFTDFNWKYLNKIVSNVVSIDIISAYPEKLQKYKLPFGLPIYDCNCDNDDLLNSSEHYKLFELVVKRNMKTIVDKQNLIPVNFIQNDQKTGKEIKLINYFPFLKNRQKLYLNQYMLKIFYITFDFKPSDLEIKKTMCFDHKIQDGFQKFVTKWKKEKDVVDKKVNPSYYDFVKRIVNSVTGKFSQKEFIEEVKYFVDENNVFQTEKIVVKEFDDVEKFSYTPVVAAITAMTRLQLLSMIERVGWNNWLYSDTDSCKIILNKTSLLPENNPTYLNLINNHVESIYNKNDQKEFGKWDYEWKSDKFKVIGKKKYIYELNNEVKIVCSGATNSVKKDLNFENFQIGFSSEAADIVKQCKLNGIPILLPTTFAVKNIFLSIIKFFKWNKSLLHDYLLPIVDELYFLSSELSKKNEKRYSTFVNKDEIILALDRDNF